MKIAQRIVFWFCVLLTAMLSVQTISAQKPLRKAPKTRVATEKKENKANVSFDSPDFAYPVDIKKNAGEEYVKAMEGKRYVDAIRALIQMDIARTCVSRDSVLVNIQMLHDAESRMPAPYAQLISLLEARLYYDIYNDRGYVYSERTLPAGEYPADPRDWSKDLFMQKITTLIQQSQNDIAKAEAMPMSEIMPVISNYDVTDCAGMNVADFMTICINRMTSRLAGDGDNVLPFDGGEGVKATPGNQLRQLRDNAVETSIVYHKQKGERLPFVQMTLLKASYLPDKEAKNLIESLLSADNTPYQALLVYSRLYERFYVVPGSLDKDRLADTRKFYASLSDYLTEQKQKDASMQSDKSIKKLDQLLAQFDLQQTTMSSPNAIVSDKDIEVEVSSVNMSEGYILLYNIDAISRDKNNINKALLLKSGRLVQCVPFKFADEKLFTDKGKFTFKGVKPGYYAFMASTTPYGHGIPTVDNRYTELNITTFDVTDIALISSVENGGNNSSRIYVVDGRTQKPLAGVDVTFKGRKRGSRGYNEEVVKLKSGSDGSCENPLDYGTAIVNYRGSYAKRWIGRGYSSDDGDRWYTNIMPSLALYHPGDTVEYAVVVYKNHDRNLSVGAGRQVEMRLIDVNGEQIGKKTFTADSDGRFSGKFVLPQGVLLGRYQLCSKVLKDNGSDGVAYSSESIQVAEYKTPTFSVEVNPVNIEEGADKLEITGTVRTYSGMPVADSDVAIKINWEQWMWWRYGRSNASYGTQTQTDAKGEFRITLPLDGIKASDYRHGIFNVTATVTAPGGEMQTSSPVRFALEEGYAINPQLPGIVDLDGDKEFKVTVSNSAGQPVVKTIKYVVSCAVDNKVVVSGEFESPVFTLKNGTLPSGRYKFTFSLAGDDAAKDSTTVVIYHKEDVRPPYATSLWTPQSRIIAEKGAKKVKVMAGGSYAPSYILCETADTRRVLRREWKKCDGENFHIEVDAPAENERVFVKFSGMHDLQGNISTVEILPYESQRKLTAEVVTFRDKIESGGKEKWTFRFKGGDLTDLKVTAMAVMSDKSLNAITPFSWRFNPHGVLDWNSALQLYADYPGTESSSYTFKKAYGYTRFNPIYKRIAWNTYGYNLYGRYSGTRATYHITGASPRNMKRAELADAETPVEMESMDEVFLSSAESDYAMEQKNVVVKEAEPLMAGSATSAEKGKAKQTGVTVPEEVKLRESQCPLAFFMPNLNADANGDLTLEFQAPDFNTTWALQLIGYTPYMYSCKLDLQTVASKPVMVQSSQPRFARTGDKVQLSATLFNNTDKAQKVSGTIVVFCPATKVVLAEYKSEPMLTQPSASQVVRLEFTAPDNLPEVGVKMIATGENGSDGEQSMLTILPSSSPVVESTPFYLKPGKGEFVQKLPEYKGDATLTLSYCDNPVWTCVTALPGISYTDSDNLTSMLYALFGNVMATGLTEKYPQIKDALKYWKEESATKGTNTLISKLSQDEENKIVKLNATPFVNSAETETLRMMGLQVLLDSAYNHKTVERLFGKIEKLQNRDGGWSWLPGFESSAFMTQKALTQFGVLNNFGYLDRYGDRVRNMIRRGVEYCDGEIVESYRKYPNDFCYSCMADYLYVRSSLGDIPAYSTFAMLREKALNEIARDWKNFSIYNKSQAAILLWRHGKKDVAADILNSLRQYATHSNTRGVWFDNLESGYNGWSKLRDTSRALEAFALISPKDEMVDGMRQWLVLQRQTQDWGDCRFTSETINAILLSGSNWTDNNNPSRITIGGKEIEVSAADKYMGEIKTTLSVAETSGAELRIEKNSEGPAWGGVLEQYMAPATSIKAASTELISLTKEVYLLETTDKGTNARKVKAENGSYNIKEGSTVRVVLTLTTKQDMNYVAITDERAACFEPVKQLSGLEWNDGQVLYRETLDSQTNIFYNFLPKGQYVVSYDCYVTRDGVYALGIATVQSQYAPLITAHSSGSVVTSK